MNTQLGCKDVGDLSDKAEVMLSLVIPVYNEEDALPHLYQALKKVLSEQNYDYEIIFVDDGSRDGSRQVLRSLRQEDPRIRIIAFRRNFGKAAALDCAFKSACGRIIVTMDADLQDEPGEIPRFLSKLDEGYDLVSGWKFKRYDPVSKTLPSKLFNRVTAAMSGLDLHDFNCGFKAYRREVVQEIELYGELHRYIPVLAHWRGFKVAEIEVEHHPRLYGTSKYGWERFARGFFDLLTVTLLTKYIRRPLHFFGSIGAVMSSAGILIGLYMSALWLA
ncbi:MAG: glycosyltransferase family 2 protein, partial [bacterium]|nr:glycosyltransferase family 2 protein [bacterium]